MDLRDSYARQVRLLMATLPHVAKESCFALKGGTAINSSCSVISKIPLTGRCIAIPKFNTYRLFAGSCVIWQC